MAEGKAVSRRGVIAAGAVTLAAAPAMVQGIGLFRMSSQPFEALSYSDWQGYVGTLFRVLGESSWTMVQLDSIEVLPNSGARPRDLPRAFGFIANFSAPLATAPAGNATYEISFGGLASGALFLTRGRDSGDSARFSAVFN